MARVKHEETSMAMEEQRTVVGRLVEQQQRWLKNRSASHCEVSEKINLDEKRTSKGKTHPSDQSDDLNVNLMEMHVPPTTAEGSRLTFLILFAES